MKKITLLFFFFIVTAIITAQPFNNNIIKVCFGYNTHIIFEKPIANVSVGTLDTQIETTISETHKQILYVALKISNKEKFVNTNMIVETEEQTGIYSFIIKYDCLDSPYFYKYYIINDQLQRTKNALKSKPTTPIPTTSKTYHKSLMEYAKELNNNHKMLIQGVNNKEGQIKMKVDAIFIVRDTLLIMANIKNKNTIPYEFSFIKVSKKTYNQETKSATVTELSPVTIYNNTKAINGKATHQFTIIVPAFSLDNNSTATIELKEGGKIYSQRDITLEIPAYIFNDPVVIE